MLINNWEVQLLQIQSGQLLRLARQAKRLGVELFVLDDGWFGKTDSDARSLGDYAVNRGASCRSACRTSPDASAYGLAFGLWFEPRCE